MKRYCIFCDGEVKKGEGGACTVLFALSNRPTVTVYVHTRCLKPYLRAVEDSKPRMPEQIRCDGDGRAIASWDGRVVYAGA